MAKEAKRLTPEQKHENPAQPDGPAKDAAHNPPQPSASVADKNNAATSIHEEEREEEQREKSNWFIEWTERLFYDLKITDIVIALASIALAVYTLQLRRSTDQLAKEGALQRRDARRNSAHQAWQTRKSLAIAKESADVARDQLSLAYPPRLRVMNLNIYEVGKDGAPVSLTPGKELKGHAFVVNTGRECAVIDIPKCITYWRVGPIPMDRTFFDDKEQATDCSDFVDKADHPVIKGSDGHYTALNPGDFYKWNIKTVVPASYTVNMKLYVIGFICYRDRLTDNRFVLFARMYDPIEQRFVASKNPDYEGQDYE